MNQKLALASLALTLALQATSPGAAQPVQAAVEAAHLVPGGASLALNGTTQYLTVTHAPELNNSAGMTWEAWVKRNNATRCETVFGKDFATNYWLGFCGNKLRFYSGGTGTSQDAPVNVPADGWHHIAVSWADGGLRRYYIDGAEVYSGTAGAGSSGNAVLGIGADFNGNFKFAGNLAELRIWNRVRTTDEIHERMNAALTGRESALVAYWPLAEDFANKVNGKTATPVGSPTFGGEALPWAGACGGIYEAIKDAPLNEASPTLNDGDSYYLDLASMPGARKTALLGFAPPLTPGLTIYSARLEVWMDSQVPPPVYEIEALGYPYAFDENTVTWNNSSAPSGPRCRGRFTAPFGWLSLDVTPHVIGWLTADATKHNLYLQTLPATMTVSLQSRENNMQPRLIIDCAAPDADTTRDMAAAEAAQDAAQGAAIDKLNQNSSTPVTLELDAGGTVRFASFRITVPPTVTGNSDDRARWFMREYRDLLRLSDPDEQLQLVGHSPDTRHLTYRRRENGIPIFPAELVMHVDGQTISGMNGRYVGNAPTPRRHRFEVTVAQLLATQVLSPTSPIITETLPVGDSQLVLVNRGLLGMNDPHTRPAWRVTVRGARNETVFIDANTGERLLGLPHELDAFDLEMRNARAQRSDNVFCWIFIGTDYWFDEFGRREGTPDAAGSAAFASAQAIDAYWRRTLGQDGWNGRGEKQNAILNEGGAPGSPGWLANAYYSPHCNNMSFGQSMSTLDVIGHEWTHAFVNRNGDLTYQMQSGALNESVADIMGFMVDQDDDTIGEGSGLGVLRNLRNPPAQGHPDHMQAALSGDGLGLRMLPPGTGPDCSPSGNDCGFVHTNSGIHNKVGGLLIFGGLHTGRNITALGANRVGQLYRNVIVNRRVSSSAQFIDMRNAALAEARAMGFSPLDICQVQNAYASVGLGDGDADCDGRGDSTVTDSDNDGVPNTRDNCPSARNGSQQDLDRDGIGDACDPDIDGDGVPNASDNCRIVANPDQANRDGDGFGDLCDDGDADGVIDILDNCPAVANRDQRDRDGDRRGDVCDPDRDGDGVPNDRDNAPNDYNPGQADGDADGIGDVIDLCRGVTSSDNSDIDRDGRAPACDDDDDGDGVLDAGDNCPSTPNADQIDHDGNGMGLACDAGEQEALSGNLRGVSGQIRATITRFPIPVPACLSCPTGEGLRANFGIDLVVNPPPNMGLRVVDNTGAAVGTMQIGSTLRFFPAPNASSGFRSVPLARGYRSAEYGTPADGVSYQLELYMLNGQPPTQPISMTVGMRAGNINAAYLPAVAR